MPSSSSQACELPKKYCSVTIFCRDPQHIPCAGMWYTAEPMPYPFKAVAQAGTMNCHSSRQCRGGLTWFSMYMKRCARLMALT